jgi:nitroreductase
VACVELKIDACPMEGFERDKFDALLGLPERGLSTSVIAAVGYRSGEDPTQFRKKVRKPAKLLFEYLP